MLLTSNCELEAFVLLYCFFKFKLISFQLKIQAQVMHNLVVEPRPVNRPYYHGQVDFVALKWLLVWDSEGFVVAIAFKSADFCWLLVKKSVGLNVEPSFPNDNRSHWVIKFIKAFAISIAKSIHNSALKMFAKNN